MATVWINPAFKDKFPEKKEEKPVLKEKSDPKEPEQKKEEKDKPEKKKEEKKKEKSGKKAKKPGKKRLAPPSKMEMKFLQYIEDNNIPVEIKFIGNKAKLTGKIIWSSDHMMCFKPDKKKSNSLIFNRLRLIYYKALEEVSLSVNDLLAMSRIKMEPEIINKLAQTFPVEKLEPLTGKIFTEETLEEEIKKLDFTEEVKKIMMQIKAMMYLGFIEKREFQRFKDEKVPLTFHIMDNQKIKGNLDWYEHLVYHVRSLDGKEEYNIQKNSVIYIEAEEVAA